jgi:hypothetical protein
MLSKSALFRAKVDWFMVGLALQYLNPVYPYKGDPLLG